MEAKLVETELPLPCTWCGKPLHAYLNVEPANRSHDTSIILCPACDSPAAPMLRRRVVAFGHLEKRNDVFVWVEGKPHRGRSDRSVAKKLALRRLKHTEKLEPGNTRN